jgi:hypothetical protein
VLLAIGALILLGHAAIRFSQDLMHASMPAAVIGLLDRLLLGLMTIELLYTVQVSFREHALAPEPFLVVGLVSEFVTALVTDGNDSALHEIAAASNVGRLRQEAAIPIRAEVRGASNAALRRRS